MNRGLTGEYEISSTAGETVKAFIPSPLPPQPPLDLSGSRQRLLERALVSCGRLDALTAYLPDPDLFLYGYVRREAVLSSQIEGTQASLSDLLLFELEDAPGAPLGEVVDVSNYVGAVEHGVSMLRSGFPVSARMIKEVHARLLSRGRGAGKKPGEFRITQNWIGGTRPGNESFVPPPPRHVVPCISDLEKFIHADDHLPALVRAALVHVQFETIHPFLDGNGRIGRLLIVLMLIETGIFRAPILYLSLHFKRRRAEYYRLLDAVRFEGAWEAWVDFFVEGVAESAEEAVAAANRLLTLFREHETVATALGATALIVYKRIQKRPTFTINDIAAESKVSFPTASSVVDHFHRAGLLRELTGRKRNRVFAYAPYIDILNEHGEPFNR